MTITLTIPASYDHLDRCVGCGEDSYQGCGTVADCPRLRGQVTAPMVLRAAAGWLWRFPINDGADIAAAIAAAANFFLTGTSASDEIHDLAHEARTALATYLIDRFIGHGQQRMAGDDLIALVGRLAPRSVIAAFLFCAAARVDDNEYEVEDGEFDDFDKD